jgi:hypothetical protein
MTTQEIIKSGLGAASAGFGFAAAILWLFASLQNVRPRDKSSFNTSAILINIPNIKGEASDVLATAARQSYWNGWAALSAAIAAMCQAPLVFM